MGMSSFWKSKKSFNSNNESSLSASWGTECSSAADAGVCWGAGAWTEWDTSVGVTTDDNACGITQVVIGAATLDDEGIGACHGGCPVVQGDIAPVGIAACHGTTGAVANACSWLHGVTPAARDGLLHRVHNAADSCGCIVHGEDCHFGDMNIAGGCSTDHDGPGVTSGCWNDKKV